MRNSRFVRILFAIPAFITFVATAQNNLPPDVQAMAKKVMMPLALRVPGMDKVKVIENLKYTKTDDPNVLMDILTGGTRAVVSQIFGRSGPDWHYSAAPSIF